MGVSEAQAREILINVAPMHALAWYQAVQAIARGEGDYGNGWHNKTITEGGVTYVNAGEGSNNWGAVQCGHSTSPGGDCGPACFPNLDRHADGRPYQGCFKRYATPELGASDFVFILTDNGPGAHNRARVAAALDANGESVDADAVAQAMHATGYMELAADKYAAAIVRNATSIAQSLGETLRVHRAGDAPPSTNEGDDGGPSLGEVCVALLVAVGSFYAVRG